MTEGQRSSCLDPPRLPAGPVTLKVLSVLRGSPFIVADYEGDDGSKEEEEDDDDDGCRD